MFFRVLWASILHPWWTYVHHLSQLKFDGENGVSITRHLSDFCDFGECYEIYDQGLFFFLFSLSLEGRTKKWCCTLPKSSIHSFEQLASELQQAFHRYDFHNVLIKINDIRMEPQESLDEFSIRFVHYFFEFHEKDVDWRFIREQDRKSVV